ncbi:MAG: restriction endonuclease subunit S, partial [Nitrospiraceae bacterium]
RPKNAAYDPQFFYYALTSRIFDDFLTKLQAGSTISHLYQKDFVNFSFLAPATVAEQAAIAEVLSDMDAEIAALDQRLAKTRALKLGMMQELLTGKTRLI